MSSYLERRREVEERIVAALADHPQIGKSDLVERVKADSRLFDAALQSLIARGKAPGRIRASADTATERARRRDVEEQICELLRRDGVLARDTLATRLGSPVPLVESVVENLVRGGKAVCYSKNQLAGRLSDSFVNDVASRPPNEPFNQNELATDCRVVDYATRVGAKSTRIAGDLIGRACAAHRFHPLSDGLFCTAATLGSAIETLVRNLEESKAICTISDLTSLVGIHGAILTLALNRAIRDGKVRRVADDRLCTEGTFKSLTDGLCRRLHRRKPRSAEELRVAMKIDPLLFSCLVENARASGRIHALSDGRLALRPFVKHIERLIRTTVDEFNSTYSLDRITQQLDSHHADPMAVSYVVDLLCRSGHLQAIGKGAFRPSVRLRPDGWRCAECGTRTAFIDQFSGVPVCRRCMSDSFRFKVITKTRAMDEYRVKPHELRRLRCIERENPHYKRAAPMQLFLLSDVHNLANSKLRKHPPQVALEMYLDEGNDCIHFRPVSVLGDFVQQTSSGIIIRHRALLTHFGDTTCRFSADEIAELEHLINDGAPEKELQRFFERHPKWFGMWNMREVHEHVCLFKGSSRKDSLIPDFILTDPELYKAVLIDLKRSELKRSLVRRQTNRERFGEAISEARTQLLRYRDWFRTPMNRATLAARLGMEVYEPHLAVIWPVKPHFSSSLWNPSRQRMCNSLESPPPSK